MSQRRNTPRITGGSWKGRPLVGGVPKGTRPTSSKIREALGSRLANQLPGARILDAFAGAGAFSLEALSRGADYALALEKNVAAVECIRKSIEGFGASEQMEVKCVETVKFLERGRQNASTCFDIIFLDPPYASDLASRALTALVTGDWLGENAHVVVESSSMETAITPPPGLAILNSRPYGDTLVSFYCKTTCEGENK